MQTCPYTAQPRETKKRREEVSFVFLVPFNGTVYHRYVGCVGESRANDLSSRDKQTPRANKDFPCTIPRTCIQERHGRAKPLTPRHDERKEKGRRQSASESEFYAYISYTCEYIHVYVGSERTNFSHDEIKILSDTRWYKSKTSPRVVAGTRSFTKTI